MIYPHLSVPNVSPPTNIPSWNIHRSKKIEALFEFIFPYLTDDNLFILFFNRKDLRDNVTTFVASYDFVLWKDWWGYNKLQLCSPLDTSLKVHSKLYIQVVCYPIPIICSYVLVFYWMHYSSLDIYLFFTDSPFPHHVFYPFKSKVGICFSKEKHNVWGGCGGNGLIFQSHDRNNATHKRENAMERW